MAVFVLQALAAIAVAPSMFMAGAGLGQKGAI
jgi:hypothetical protein